jgi:hypothetical protein
MLNKSPEFDRYYVAYLKDDPANEPIATSYRAPSVLAETAHKTARRTPISNFGKQEHDRLKALLL